MHEFRLPVKKNIFVFDHLPKCAGISVSNILKKSVEHYFRVSSAGDLIDLCKKINRENYNDTIVISGHYSYGAHELVSSAYCVKYITFIRDPIKIAWSLYTFGVQRGRFIYGDFADFLKEYSFTHIIDYLGGDYNIATLRLNSYDFVGFVECFEESLQRLGRLIGVELNGTVHANKTKRRKINFDEFDYSTVFAGKNDFLLYSSFKKKSGYLFEPEKKLILKEHKTMYARTNLTVTELLEKNTVPEQVANYSDDIDSTDAIRLRGWLGKDLDDALLLQIVEANKDGFLGLLQPHMITSRERFAPLWKVAEELVEAVRHDRLSGIRSSAQKVLGFLAATPFAESSRMWRDILNYALGLNTKNMECVYNAVVLFRLKNECGRALKLLETIPAGRRDIRYCNEFITTAHFSLSANEIKRLLEEFQQYPAIRNLISFNRRQRRDADAIDSLRGKKLLLARSGPEIVFDDAHSVLRKCAASISLFMQQSYKGNEKYRDDETFFFPNGYFSATAEFEDKEKTLSRDFDAVVFAASSFYSLTTLVNFTSFFADIPGVRFYAWPMYNLYHPEDEKTLVPLHG